MLANVLLAVTMALGATAHYTFPAISVNGARSGDWEFVRRADNYQDNGFVGDVNSRQMTCFQNSHQAAQGMAAVSAGSTVTYHSNQGIFHPGPMSFYLAKVPAGQSIDSFDGSGAVWFKIAHEQPSFGSQLSWPSNNQQSFPVTIPSCIAAGDYLLRAEHLAIHTASSVGGAQFYISCAQLRVSGGGNREPNAKVAIPGAYSATDPGIQININWPIPTSYTNPGPAVFTC